MNMPIASIRSFILIAVAAIALLGPAPSAMAQSDADLRRENQRLREELQQLRREYDEQLRQMREMEKEMARLRQELANRPTDAGPTRPQPTTLPEPEITVDESVPNASPRALHAALTANYREKLGTLEIGELGSGERTAYMRSLERWRQSVSREFKQRVAWHVKVSESSVLRNGDHRMRFIAIDPVSAAELGAPFDAVVSRGVVKRLRTLERRMRLDTLVLTGVVTPTVRINPDRFSDAGAFKDYDLLGPFAEYGFEVDVQTLLPPEDPKDESGKS
ncbi:MAG: hypothetical protein AAF432_07370 [Planctomycetota bacterium]